MIAGASGAIIVELWRFLDRISLWIYIFTCMRKAPAQIWHTLPARAALWRQIGIVEARAVCCGVASEMARTRLDEEAKIWQHAPLAALLRTFRWAYLHPGTHLTGQIASMIHHPNPYTDVNLCPSISEEDATIPYHRSQIVSHLAPSLQYHSSHFFEFNVGLAHELRVAIICYMSYYL